MAGRAVDPEQPAALGDRVGVGQGALRHLRAAAEFLDVLAELADLLVGEDRGFRSACASWRAIGIRPVPTWNSTAAEPTPTRLGPRPSTPCALRPWQETQLTSNSALPSAAAPVIGAASCAWACIPGANTV
ncbi:hypothetical protein GCM10027605_52080 [Micromonospora zhanjiangensis]